MDEAGRPPDLAGFSPSGKRRRMGRAAMTPRAPRLRINQSTITDRIQTLYGISMLGFSTVDHLPSLSIGPFM